MALRHGINLVGPTQGSTSVRADTIVVTANQLLQLSLRVKGRRRGRIKGQI